MTTENKNTKLIVSEKDNTAKRISSILSNGKAKQEKLDGISVYKFNIDGSSAVAIGLKGHIVKIDYPSKYRNWQDVNPAELITAPLVKVVSQKKIARSLKKVAQDADEVIIATDFDREGELIGVEALDKIYEVKKDLPVKRARFSSLTEEEIKHSFANLENIYKSLAEAGETRQDIDLIWGATLTRFLSLASSRLGKSFLSVGRVQSPTLALIVNREKERQAFVSTPYWQIKLRLSSNGDEFIAEHKTDRFLDKIKAKDIVDKIKSSETKEAIVADKSKTVREIKPPAPFNTTAFFSAASSVGINPAAAMSIAESLYIKGIISYPRVDNTVYPATMNHLEIIERFKKSSEFGNLATKIISQDKITPTRGKKQATDHPPIHPTDIISKDKLGAREWKIYELVTRRYFATLAPSAVQETVKANIECEKEPFISKGTVVLQEGWMEHYPYTRRKDEELPSMSKGQKLNVLECIFDEKETQPPTRYGQGRLIEEMEKLGLGTKATRHSIIQNLYERGYIFGDPIEPTETGIAVTNSLQTHAETITTPKMTAELEEDMTAIAEEKQDKEKVVSKSREMLAKIMKILEEKKEQVATDIRQGIRLDQIIGKCPNCGENLRIIKAKKSKKRFVGCTNYPKCSTSFPLPQFGGIISTGEVCPQCNSPKIKIIKKGSRPWELCIDPKCPTKQEAKDKKQEAS